MEKIEVSSKGIRVIKFKKEDKIILLNPLTGKRIFTTNKLIRNIPKKDLKELREMKFNLEKPQIRRYRIEVTFQCNATCDYCLVYKNPLKQKNNAMKLETAKVISMRFNKEVKGGDVMLIGGEPLTNWAVVKYFIENIKGNVFVFTNATLIDEEKAKILSKSNVITFVSLDGRKIENFHRKDLEGMPLFDKTIKGYTLLKKYGAKTGISCLVTNDNVDQLFEIVKYFHEELGEKAFGLSFPHKCLENNFEVNIKKYTAELIHLVDYAKKKRINVSQMVNLLRPLISNQFRLYGCKIVGEQRTFYPDGKETLCTKLDILKEFDNKTGKDLFKLLPVFREDCKNCGALFVCGGGCFWDAFFNKDKKDKKTCYFTKHLVKSILWDMHKNCPKNKLIEKEDLKEHLKLVEPNNS